MNDELKDLADKWVNAAQMHSDCGEHARAYQLMRCAHELRAELGTQSAK